MTSEEGREVLRLLAEKKVTAEQAHRLLLALGDLGTERPRRASGAPPGPGGRVLRIRVTEGGQQKVNIAVPLAIARLERVRGLKHVVKRFGLDLDDLIRDVHSSAIGKIVDIADDDDRVEVYVE